MAADLNLKIFTQLFRPFERVAKVCPPCACIINSGGLGSAQTGGDD